MYKHYVKHSLLVGLFHGIGLIKYHLASRLSRRPVIF